ncbi:hypothetical protein [Croceimicrobium sp.]|uniref:hypothetical protein n=1 Tax=Croceimicrobium sp. TaxID=2828340 RepID=UPI003BAA3D1F
MLRNIIIQLYLFLQPGLGMSQSLSADSVAILHPDLKECSGMAFIAPNALAMINDSGNDAELFICDTLGNLILRSPLKSLVNHDWESLAYADGKLYIGDFGNNDNKRQNLEVLVLDISKLLTEGKWTMIAKIPFSYPEQKAFPPEDSERYYDLEAMVVYEDSLFLFTKNRTKPFDGKVKVYGLSRNPAPQKAKLIKEFKTASGIQHFNWVSGACLSPNGEDLFLLGYSKIWYVESWRKTERIKAYPYSLGNFSQKEAMAIRGASLYFAEEELANRKPYLYKVSIPVFNQESKGDSIIQIQESYVLGQDSLELQFPQPHYYIGVEYGLYDQSGALRLSGHFKAEELRQGTVKIPLEGLSPGSYIFSIQGEIKKAFRFELK